MNSGQRSDWKAGRGIHAEPHKLPCSNRSAEVLLVILILLSLYIVTAYDWLLSRILKLFRRLHTATTFQNGFDTTHLSRSFARRVRPID